MAFVAAYVRFLTRYRYVVCLTWIAVAAVSAYWGPELLSRTSVTVEAPPHTAASKAESLQASYFPAGKVDSVAVVLERVMSHDASNPVNMSILGPDTECFMLQLEKHILSWNNSLVLGQSSIASYYTLMARSKNFEPLALKTLCPNKPPCNQSVGIFDITLTIGSQTPKQVNSFVTKLRSTTKDIKSQCFNASHIARVCGEGGKSRECELNSAGLAPVRIDTTGMPAFGADIMTGTLHDIEVMDGVAFPVALLVLVFVLDSFRLLLFPVINIAFGILISFAFMLPVALNYSVVSYCPSMMMSASIAMSIDYSLFLLTRFREEIRGGKAVHEAVECMLATAGHTVLVSGLTLSLSFFGLIIFPVSFLWTPGLGTGLAVLLVLVLSLSLTPAGILMFPEFFRRGAMPSKCRGQHSSTIDEKTALLTNTQTWADKEASTEHSLWLSFADFVLRPLPAALLLLIVIGLAGPCAYRALDFEATTDVVSFLQRGAESTDGYRTMSKAFGPALLFSYDLVAVSPSSVNLLSTESFNFCNQLLTDLMALNRSQNMQVAGIMNIDGLKVPFAAFEAALQNCSTELGSLACEAMETMVNENHTATIIDLTPDFEPASEDGQHWLKDVRQVLRSYENGTGWRFGLTQGYAAEIDAQDEVYSLFPTAIGVTSAVVFVLIGVSFKSLIIPLRSLFTISLTLSFVYGCAAWIYEYGVLDGLHFAGLAGRGAVCWITPVICFSVLVGLSLDYDVFLLSRVVEYRMEALSDRDSIKFGVWKTGPIITAAGLIMAIAFVGLLFSTVPVLNQLSFFLVFAVLIDTFIIRSAVVPACMFFLGRVNWFPRKMPAVQATTPKLQ